MKIILGEAVLQHTAKNTVNFPVNMCRLVVIASAEPQTTFIEVFLHLFSLVLPLVVKPILMCKS